MIYHDIEQNTEQWLQLRSGKFTGSIASTLFMGKTTKGYKDLIYQVAYERLFNEPCGDGFKNFWTDRGHELEPIALEQYQLDNFVKGKSGGFCELNEWVGCSPDFILPNNKLVQVKCPKFSTQIDYLITKKVPSDYYAQCQFEIMVTGLNECDLYMYHPRLKPLTITIKRDNAFIKEIETELETAKKSVELIIDKIK